jgi:nucleoside-diphosphate-sugar epimerase
MILVTGGLGMIGAHTARALPEDPVDFFRVGVTDHQARPSLTGPGPRSQTGHGTP